MELDNSHSVCTSNVCFSALRTNTERMCSLFYFKLSLLTKKEESNSINVTFAILNLSLLI